MELIRYSRFPEAVFYCRFRLILIVFLLPDLIEDEAFSLINVNRQGRTLDKEVFFPLNKEVLFFLINVTRQGSKTVGREVFSTRTKKCFH